MIMAVVLFAGLNAMAQPAKPDPELIRLSALAEQAYALNMADDHAAAEPALREVLEGWRAAGLGQTEATRSTVLLWAWSLIELARFDEAEAELRAITAATDATGPQQVSAWALLAKTYARSGRFQQAEEAAVAALDHAVAAYGPDHAETAAAWHNLGTARGEMGRNSDAVAALRRAVALREGLFGADGEPTLVSIYNLAAHLHAVGRLNDAEALLREVLAHAEPGSESHVYALHHLGFTLSQMERHAEAETWLRQAVDRRALMPDRSLEAVSLSALADALRGQGRHAEARAAYGRALELIEANDYAGLAMLRSAVLLGLAENQQAEGRVLEAETAYRQSIAIARAHLLQGHPRLVARELGLAGFLNDQQRASEALTLLRPARDALLARTRNLEGGETRLELDRFRSLFRETVQATWNMAQPEGGDVR